MRKKMKSTAHYIVGFLVCALIVSSMSCTDVFAAKKISLSSKKIVLKEGGRKTIKVKNSNKRVKWKVTFGKGNITLKKKGKMAVTVLAKKKGTARFQAIVGKTKRTCKVTIADTKADTKTDAGVISDLPPVTADQPAAPIITRSPYINTKEPDPDPTPAATPAPTPVPVAVPVNAPEGADASDVEALKFLIKDQYSRGASVSEDMSNKDQYTWEEGKLTGITWFSKNLTGELDTSGCVNLKQLQCSFNRLASLKVQGNMQLKTLGCSCNLLSSLDLSQNTALWNLYCDGNQLSELDVSHNVNLASLYCKQNDIKTIDVSGIKRLLIFECDPEVTVIGKK